MGRLHLVGEPALGERMYSRGFVLRGKLQIRQWKALLRECAKAMGMNPVAEPAVWKYPIGGQGGNGHTIVQPITESFIALDIWPDHDGAYLFICSCRHFSPSQLRDPVTMAGLDLETIGSPITLELK